MVGIIISFNFPVPDLSKLLSQCLVFVDVAANTQSQICVIVLIMSPVSCRMNDEAYTTTNYLIFALFRNFLMVYLLLQLLYVTF